jgi:recombination protein RecT
MTETPPTKALTVREFFTQPAIFSRFEEIMGNREAAGYIAQVGIAVANSDKLRECTHQSIFISAMRAATLRLSVDPATGEAHLVPYGKKATLIVGYKGLMQMALRTLKYRYINTGKIYEGETVEEDRITGYLKITGSATSKNVIGWISAFELVAGYGKAIYMTLDEIYAHAKKYSPSFSYNDSVWKTNPESMERKTILRRLLSQWGYFDPSDKKLLEEVDEQPIDVDFSPVEEDAQQGQKLAEKTEAELLQDLGF